MRQAVIIVIPCFNEARRLDVARFSEFARQAAGVQLLFVNDGSSDDTAACLNALHQSHPTQIEVLHLPHNVGKAEAVRQGLLAAFQRRPAYAGFWDADLATPLHAIPSFCEVLDRKPHIDLVMGSRMPLLGHQIVRKFHRRLLGRTFAWCASRILGLRIYDTQCGAKLFRSTPAIVNLFATSFRSRWIFDVEILARMNGVRPSAKGHAIEDSIYEFPLDQWHDVEGSKLRPKDFFCAALELTMIGRTYRLRSADAELPHQSTHRPTPAATQRKVA